jgi:WG containing repeat
MKHPVLILVFVCSILTTSYGQQPNLLSANTSNGYGTEVRLAELDNTTSARKATMEHLRTARVALEGDRSDPLVGDETPNGSTDVFTAYLGRLEKKYAAALRTIESDNIRDVFQIDQKSNLKRRYSLVLSAQCLCNKSEGNYLKIKDLEGRDLVAVSLEPFRQNPRYGMVENYRQGFARIKKDQVFGYMNVCGEEFIPAQYEQAEPFNDGRALVKKINWYYIDAKGQESEALENVSKARMVGRGLSIATLKTGKEVLIDNTYDVSKKTLSDPFDEIEPFFKDELFKVRVGKKFGILRADGTLKMDISFDNLQATSVENLMRVTVGAKMGLIDSLGNVKIKPEYDFISDFNEYGLAEARDVSGSRLVESKELRTSKVFSSIGVFDQYGLSVVKDATGRFGLLNMDLQTIKEPIFTSISSFNQFGLAAVCRQLPEGVKCGYLRYDGSTVIPFNYDEVGSYNKQGLVVVTESVARCQDVKGACKTDVIYDKNGNLVVAKSNDDMPEKVRFALDTVLLNRQFIPLRAYDKDNQMSYHLIDKNSMRRITPQGFQRMKGSYDVNLCFAVMSQSKWGLMDTTGKMVVPCTFKRIESPSEGYYAVQNETSKWGFIDKKGKPQIPYDYDEVRPFYNNLSIVSKGKDRVGLINRFNGKIAPCAFRSVQFVSNTRQYELTDASDVKYLLNINGECEGNCQKFEELRKNANTQ